jgi:hypothetical protein
LRSLGLIFFFFLYSSLIEQVNCLSASELRQLSVLLDARKQEQGLVEYDIVGNAPVEVIFNIVSHLGIADFWQCFLVCHLWNRLFRSADVLSFALRQYFPGEPMPHHDISTISSKGEPHLAKLYLDSLRAKCQRSYRFRFGTPPRFCPSLGDILSGSHRWENHIVYESSKFSFIYNQVKVLVYDIPTRSYRSYQTKNIELLKLSSLVLSRNLVAAISKNG